jgi:hypothetical protein
MTKQSVHSLSHAHGSPFGWALLSLTTLAFGCSDGPGSGADSVTEAVSSAITVATNLDPDPVNLVYRDDFFVDAMTFDPATGMLMQHFSGNLYLPTVLGQNQLVSIGGSLNGDDSSHAKVAVDGTWFLDPSTVAGFDPSAPPPVMQMRPDGALSHVRFAFDDGSVLETLPSSHPLLSANFTLGSSIATAGSSHYDFLFTETCALLKETAGKGRYAGMVGTYTFHQGVAVVGPNLQVHSRGIAMLTLKDAS